MTMRRLDAHPLFVDGHVHLHDSVSISESLDAATRNFTTAARNIGLNRSFHGVLLLAETANAKHFSRLLKLSKSESIGPSPGWIISQTDEGGSLIAQKQGSSLVIIAGRQIVTAEKLEVLALCTEQSFREGESIHRTLEKIHQSGGVPVLPWGFGKWLGTRGRVVFDLLQDRSSPAFFVGDSGARTSAIPTPHLIKSARKLGIKVVSGSDPLPLSWDVGRIGSFGFYLDFNLSPKMPTLDIKHILWSNDIEIQPYGSLEKLLQFVRSQLMMRVRKK